MVDRPVTPSAPVTLLEPLVDDLLDEILLALGSSLAEQAHDVLAALRRRFSTTRRRRS